MTLNAEQVRKKRPFQLFIFLFRLAIIVFQSFQDYKLSLLNFRSIHSPPYPPTDIVNSRPQRPLIPARADSADELAGLPPAPATIQLV